KKSSPDFCSPGLGVGVGGGGPTRPRRVGGAGESAGLGSLSPDVFANGGTVGTESVDLNAMKTGAPARGACSIASSRDLGGFQLHNLGSSPSSTRSVWCKSFACPLGSRESRSSERKCRSTLTG